VLHRNVVAGLKREGILDLLLKYYPNCIDGSTDVKPTMYASRLHVQIEPHQFPVPTLEEVKSWPERGDMTDEDCLKFWTYNAAKDWRDAKRKPFQDRRKEMLDWRRVMGIDKEKNQGGPTRYSVGKKLKALKEALNRVVSETFIPTAGGVPRMTEAAKKRRDELLVEIAETSKQLKELEDRFK
jgi:hypothetical protein